MSNCHNAVQIRVRLRLQSIYEVLYSGLGYDRWYVLGCKVHPGVDKTWVLAGVIGHGYPGRAGLRV